MSVERLPLADGRSLDVEVVGPERGTVCVYHHGTPGSVMSLGFMAGAASARDLRLVTYNRAGYGGSTRQPGRVVGDIAGDIAQVLDHVGADRCVTFGWSGGGPHALACAALLPDRVAAVASVAGVKPFTSLEDWTAGMGEDNVEEFALAIQGADAMDEAFAGPIEAMAQASAEDWIEIMQTILSPGDVQVLRTPVGAEIAAYMSAGLTSAAGLVDDEVAFAHPWGCELSSVTAPAFIWQGSEDLSVPAAHLHGLAGLLPHAEVHFAEGAGHIDLLTESIGEILDGLIRHL